MKKVIPLLSLFILMTSFAFSQNAEGDNWKEKSQAETAALLASMSTNPNFPVWVDTGNPSADERVYHDAVQQFRQDHPEDYAAAVEKFRDEYFPQAKMTTSECSKEGENNNTPPSRTENNRIK